MKVLPYLLALCLSGCIATGATRPTYEDAADSRLIAANYAAVDQLLAGLRLPLDTSTPLLVATLVNIDQLNESSRLGRLISEQASARLTRTGHTVIEVKLRGNLFVREGTGELLLSRELKDITTQHHAQAVLVGTYAIANQYVYINLKVVGVHSNTLLSAHDYVLPLDDNIRAMLPAQRPRN